MRTVEVIVSRDGSVKVTYDGFVGDSCFQEARRIYYALKRLGAEVSVEQVQPTDVAVATRQETRLVNHG